MNKFKMLYNIVATQQPKQKYKYIEYIESDGQQWINTRLPNTGDYIFKIKFYLNLLATPSGDGNWIIGGRLNPNYSLGVFRGSSGIFNAYGGASKMSSTNVNIKQWVDLYFSRTTMTTTVGSSTFTYTISGGILIPEKYKTDILLGKNQINYAGTGDDIRNLYGRLAECEIYDATTNILLRDYKPAIDDADNVGMIDEVNNTFEVSEGPKSYVPGPVI